VEGGSRIITSFLKEGLADRLVIATAPKILGKGIEAVSDLDIDDLDRAIQLDIKKIMRSGVDIILDARMKKGTPALGKKKQ